MDKNFLLYGETAKHLYFDFAEKLPVIDYHNHLNVSDLVNGRKFENITKLWLEPDPYKHRLMRMLGVSEDLITGNASDKEKFFVWCKSFPQLVGTPVYHWAKLELERVFGICDAINEKNAPTLWDKLNEMLQKDEYSLEKILKKFNIEYSAPCCSLFQDVSNMKREDIAPSLRGDDICAPTKELLEKAGVNSLEEYEHYIETRVADFHNVGCRFSDHALDNGFRYYEDDGMNGRRFTDILNGAVLSKEEKQKFTCHVLRKLAQEYTKHGWTVQLHIGAQRFTSTRLRKLAGGAGGFAGIGNSVDVDSLTKMLDEFEQNGSLPRIILFTLNPADDQMLSVLSGSYSADNVRGLVVQGPAWWWCDHIPGIKGVLDSVSAYGLLSNFPGMTTDSRSILSFVRHEYFRRILCSYIGEKIDSGEMENDDDAAKELIERMCYKNAKNRIEGK